MCLRFRLDRLLYAETGEVHNREEGEMAWKCREEGEIGAKISVGGRKWKVVEVGRNRWEDNFKAPFF